MNLIYKSVQELPYKLYDYQEEAISKIKTKWEKSELAVLSICPSGGKTKTAVTQILEAVLKGGRVLILAHGTNVLKNQWTEEFDSLSIPYSRQLSDESDIVITIPQSISKKESSKEFDLLVVDEAHEFYYAKMVRNILKKIHCKRQLLLTGTPSIFIKNGVKPVIIAGTTVYQKGKLTDAYIGIVRSKYVITDKDYDLKTNDVKVDKVSNKKETLGTLESVLDEMLVRLKQNFLKGSPNILNATRHISDNFYRNASTIFGSFGKTMICTRSIEQGRQILNYLKDNGVEAVMSDSENDPNSLNIEKFKTDKSVTVLVTVRRGILGFNMVDLVNVVDFSCTRDIDRIYQLYARVLRKHPEGKRKYFFRVVSSVNYEVDSLYTQASICLNSEDFISKYNKKNLGQLDIITHKDNADGARRATNHKTISKSDKKVEVESEYFKEIIALGLMTKIVISGKSTAWDEVEYVNFGKAIGKLGHVVFYGDTKSKIIKRIEKGLNIINDDDTNDTVREILEFINPKSDKYDKYLHSRIKAYCPHILILGEEISASAIASVILPYEREEKLGDSPLAENIRKESIEKSSAYDPASLSYDPKLLSSLPSNEERIIRERLGIRYAGVLKSLIRINNDLAETSREIHSRLSEFRVYRLKSNLAEVLIEEYGSPYSRNWMDICDESGQRGTIYNYAPFMVYMAHAHWDIVKDTHKKYINSISEDKISAYRRAEDLKKSDDEEVATFGEYLDHLSTKNNLYKKRYFMPEVCELVYARFPHLVEVAYERQKYIEEEKEQKEEELRRQKAFQSFIEEAKKRKLAKDEKVPA